MWYNIIKFEGRWRNVWEGKKEKRRGEEREGWKAEKIYLNKLLKIIQVEINETNSKKKVNINKGR